MGTIYTKDDFISALKKVEIKKGDILMVHVGMSSLRALPKGIKSQDEMSQLCVDCLIEVLGQEGTLCVPSFTYSLGTGECYDSKTTPTRNIGEFPEFFRKLPGVKRSLDPFLAICAIGPMAETLLEEHANTSFGYGSFFDRFIQAGGKIATIGVGIRWATIRYHIAEIGNAPFRYLKFFDGERMINGEKKHCEWFYSVPPYSDRIEAISINMGKRIEAMLNESPLLKRSKLGNGYISCIDSVTFKDYILETLNIDPWFSGDGIDSCDKIIEEERARTGENIIDVDLDNLDMKVIADLLSPIQRDIVSDGYDSSINALARLYEFEIKEYFTGQTARGWVVPERWYCRGAFIEDKDGRCILSTENGTLETVSYTKPFDGFVAQDELKKHLYVSIQPPIVSRPYHRDWGLCCSEENMNSLSEDVYHVVIDSDFSFDSMKVGEWLISGENDEEVLIVAHLDGYKQFNYGLSGVLVGLELFNGLRKQRLKKSYRLLIVPGSVGLATWLEENEEEKIKGILMLDMMATPNGKITYMKSKYENTWIDSAIEKTILTHTDNSQSLLYNNNPFNEDEITESEISDKPVVRIMIAEQYGSPDWPFNGFQTMSDTAEHADYNILQESVVLLNEIIHTMEE